jgi:hypothetical protein
MAKTIVDSNVSLKKNKAYLLYIGGLKYLGICDFLKKPLKKHYNKDIEIIYIIPNLPACYFKGNYVVVNNKLAKLKNKTKSYVALSASDFYKMVAKSNYVKNLINKLLKNQKDIFVQLYKDSKELNFLTKYQNLKILGPQIRIFDKYDDKLSQHVFADSLGIPVPKWQLAHGKKDLIKIYNKDWKGKKAFVSQLHSAGGAGCAVVSSKKEIKNHPHIKKENTLYIISDYVNYKDSPTSGAIVANKYEVFFSGMMDQIMKGYKNLGSIYPSKLNKKTQNLIENYTIRIGKELGKRGFKGFFSLDFVVSRAGKIYFSEINPRIGGTTLEKVYLHESTKEKGMPSLPELEFRAITKNTFGRLKSNKIKKGNFSWARYSIKCDKGAKILKEFLPEYSEKAAFQKKKTTVLCFPRKDITFKTGGFVCKIVSVKPSRKQVEKELKNTSKAILEHIQKPFK